MPGAANENSRVVAVTRHEVSVSHPLSENEMPPFSVLDRIENIVSHALKVIQPISRTFRGISDTSTSSEKQALLVEGDELTGRVVQNFSSALVRLLADDHLKLNGVGDVEQFFLSVVSALNAGLTRPGQGVWRTWETSIDGQPSPNNISHHMQGFYREFGERFHQPHEDPVAFAAWIEKRLNAEIHPLADGCGRTSKALAVLVLGRADLLYPDHQSRELYFEQINRPHAEWVSYYQRQVVSANPRTAARK